jgi:hypothetical protein
LVLIGNNLTFLSKLIKLLTGIMLTQEKFDQGLEDNCNHEQGDADFPEEIDLPLYDFLHKTPIWSLSTTLKEELAKYKRYVIQPAVTPLWILKIERGPSYEEIWERVEKSLEEDTSTRYQKRSQLLEVYVAEQQALGKTTAAEIYNAYKANDPAGELRSIVGLGGPRQVQYFLDRQQRLKQVRETSNNVDVPLIEKLVSKITPSKDNLMHNAIINLDVANRRCKERFRSCLHLKTSKLLEVDVEEQQKLGKKTPAEIYNALMAQAPPGKLHNPPDLVCLSHFTTNNTNLACVPRDELRPQRSQEALDRPSAQSYQEQKRMILDFYNIN